MHAECRGADGSATPVALEPDSAARRPPLAAAGNGRRSWRRDAVTILVLVFVTLCAFAVLPAGHASAATPTLPRHPTLPQNPRLPQDTLPQGWISTAWGPLSPADRDLVIRVRQAGLWEGPAGEMAQEHTTNQKVRDVGEHLKEDHAALNEATVAVAAKLGIALPDKPTDEQQGWLNELSAAHDGDFDRIFANRLRGAHGKVFNIIASVRAGTRNDLVRSFAQTGNAVVMKHMTLLESIGLVDYNALPIPSQPALSASNVSSRTSTGINPDLVWLVLGIALIAGLVTAARVVRPR